MLHSAGLSEEPYELHVKHSISPILHWSSVLHGCWLSSISRIHMCECQVGSYGLPLPHCETHDVAQNKTGGLCLCKHAWNLLQTAGFAARGVDKIQLHTYNHTHQRCFPSPFFPQSMLHVSFLTEQSFWVFFKKSTETEHICHNFSFMWKVKVLLLMYLCLTLYEFIK